ncbi:MAG: transcriptional activator NhaR [Myxococcota bacterium]
MEWLNYHHLYYFWMVAREDTLSSASDALRLAPSTLSKQIQQLEEKLGRSLFDRSGRRLVLNDFGKVVFRYADDIFRIGQELLDFASGHPVGGRVRLRVGVTAPVPKLLARKLLEPAMSTDEQVHLVVREAPLNSLLSDLSLHQLDVVLADQPAPPDTDLDVFNHRLGRCDMRILGCAKLAAEVRPGFPESLHGVPMLLPTTGAILRRRLERWFDAHDIHPKIIAEFQDTAQMNAFGQTGLGLFPAPTVVADEIARQHKVVAIGEIEEIVEDFYAITVERREQHPAVLTILDRVPTDVF